MKKFVAVAAGFSFLALGIAFAAPPTSATGTFEGTVGPKCVVTSNIDQLTLAEYEPFNDSDGFTTELYSDKGNFTFRSNAACKVEATYTPATVPSGNSSDVSPICLVKDQTALSTAQTAPATVYVPASITANGNNGILLAGNYSFTCTITVSPDN